MKKIDLREIAKKLAATIMPAIMAVTIRLRALQHVVTIENIKKIKFDRKLFLILAAIIIVVLVLGKTLWNIHSVLFKKKPVAEQKAAVSFEEEPSPVKAYKVKKIDFKDTLPVMGNVKGFKEIDLKFQVAGIIESFNFEEGEKIQEGDIIASLIQRDALLKLKYAEIELNKNQKLFDIGALNQMKLEQSKLEYESAKSELDKTNIYAVSNGLLGAKLADVGSYETPNDKVGTFIAIDKVYAEFNIIEKDIPKIALGQKTEVFVDSYPNKSFAGTVDRIAPVIEGKSRTQVIKVEVDNKDNLLKPGMFTRGLIATYEKKDALVIPTSALKKKEAEYFVYVIQKEEPKVDAIDAKLQQKAKKKFWDLLPFGKKKEAPKPEGAIEKPADYGIIEVRKISLGYMTQDLVEVAEGLKDDELIAIEVQEELKDKTRVEIAEVQEGLF